MAGGAWLASAGGRWDAVVLLGTSDAAPDDDTPTMLRLELFSEEWGFSFRHEGKVSWIRVTDLPFVHGRDDHGLLVAVPRLRNFASLVRALEARFELRFAVEAAMIRSSLLGAEPAIRAWIGAW